jgi:hypothetical protein
MGLPPGEIAPGSVSPAPAAEGLAGSDGPGSTNGPGSEHVPGGAEGTGGAAGAGGPAAPWRAVVPRARPSTGDPRVDDAVARLDDLAGLPIAEHLAVFEYVHERLTEALGDLDVHAPARAGDHSPGARGG